MDQDPAHEYFFMFCKFLSKFTKTSFVFAIFLRRSLTLKMFALRKNSFSSIFWLNIFHLGTKLSNFGNFCRFFYISENLINSCFLVTAELGGILQMPWLAWVPTLGNKHTFFILSFLFIIKQLILGFSLWILENKLILRKKYYIDIQFFIFNIQTI